MTQALGSRVLGDWLAQLEAIQQDAHALADGLTRTQFNWQPQPTRWSIGQCLEHIARTAALYPDTIERMIAEARARQQRNERPYREGALSEWMVNGMEPPPKMRVRTKKTMVPPDDLEPAQVLAAFDAVHGRLAELMRSAEGVSLQQARMRSLFVPLFVFTLGQTFRLNLAHARRHLWQARQVREDPNFPDRSRET